MAIVSASLVGSTELSLSFIHVIFQQVFYSVLVSYSVAVHSIHKLLEGKRHLFIFIYLSCLEQAHSIHVCWVMVN